MMEFTKSSERTSFSRPAAQDRNGHIGDPVQHRFMPVQGNSTEAVDGMATPKRLETIMIHAPERHPIEPMLLPSQHR